jgi:hypothetical protein
MMYAKREGKEFEKKYIKNGFSKEIEINKKDSNGHNLFRKDSYLDNNYFMIKKYEDNFIVDTRTDSHLKARGHGKLKSVTIIGYKND